MGERKRQEKRLSDYEVHLEDAAVFGLNVKEKPLRANKGRILNNRIAIKKDLPEYEKDCILTEEIGHALFTAGDILDQDSQEDRKQELQARAYAYQRKVPLSGFIKAYNENCRTYYEVAECIGVPEWFLNEALKFYYGKYGLFFKYDKDYIIYFNPLGVFHYLRYDTDNQRRV